MEEILTLIETDDETGTIASVSFELFEAGRVLSREFGGKLSAVAIGYKLEQHTDEIARYVEKIYTVDYPSLENFNPDFYVYALERICKEVDPSYVLMAHTYKGADIAPRLSARLKVPLTTDCIGIEVDPETGLLKRKKQVFGGSVIATFICEGKPQLVTLRPKIWNRINETRKDRGEIIPLNLKIDDSLSKLKFIQRIKEETVKLDEADAIIAAGRGLGGPEGFKELEKLKTVLERFFKKVEIGASRPPVDKGWVSSSRQIGLTGEKVSPVLYVAVGISGATQHIVGIDKSKIIVAINTDPKAYIFSVADLGAVGDYKEVLPSLIKELSGIS